MKAAFVSDIHGNEIALLNCLGAIERLQIDQIHFLGDAVGYLPGEIPVLDRIKTEGFECQQGNHEAMLIAERQPDPERDATYRIAPAQARLSATTHLARIRAWPTHVIRLIAGRRFLLVHGSPSDELFGYVHEDTDLEPFSRVEADVVVMANTHRPWIRELNDKVFVNAGSVGLPRDHGMLAAFAVYDSDSERCRIVRVPLDLPEIARRYGHDIAPSVAQCFARRVERPFGEIVS